MGKALSHRLSGCPMEGDKWYCMIHYGKCLRSPYVENNLWFVVIPQSAGASGASPLSEWENPYDEHTFLVTQQYATPFIIEQFRRDVKKWEEVAHKVEIGAWCIHLECLWKDVPVYSHTFPNGKEIRYGYCRTQPRNPENANRELWYVAFKNTPTFVVDHVCVEQNFMNRMGGDTPKWQMLCWCRLEPEVRWDELIQGQDTGGYVRQSPGFALDSPHLPLPLEEIDERVESYEAMVKEIMKINPKLNWDELDEMKKFDLLGRHGWKKFFKR